MTDKKKNIVLKNRVYALGLLFSFLIIMAHDVMPHNHKDEEIHCIETLGSQLGHCPIECEPGNDFNDFPAHHHSSTDKTYYFFRSNSVEVDNNSFINLFYNCEIPQCEIYILKPLVDNKIKVENNLCFSPISFPITFSHRGPPSYLF